MLKPRIAAFQLVLAALPATLAHAGEPCRPSDIGSVGGVAEVVSLKGNTAYAATDSGMLRLYDIQDPAAPLFLSELTLPGAAMGIDANGPTVYIACDTAGLVIVNAEDPSAPHIQSIIETQARGVAYQNDRIYLDKIGLEIYDVSSPEEPSLLGATTSAGSSAGPVAVSAETVALPRFSQGVVFIDVSNASSPEIAGELDTGFASDIAMRGNLAYVASGIAGLQVVDAADPYNPVIIASLDLPVPCFDIALAGDLAYLTGRTPDVLYTVSIADPTSPTLLGSAETDDATIELAAQGNLAVLGGADGLTFFGADDPSAPEELATTNTPGYFPAFDVQVAGNIGYIASGSTLQVVDATDPSRPIGLTSLPLPGYARGVTINNHYAYVACSSAEIVVVDVSTPAAPTIIGILEGPGSPARVDLEGDHAFVIDDTDFELQVVDISNPAMPELVSSTSTSSRPLTVAAGENVAVVTVWNFGIEIYDTTNPAAPVRVSRLEENIFARGCTIRGQTAYIAANTGFHILDLSDPANPVEFARLRTMQAVSDVALVNDTAYLLSGDRIFVVRVVDPTNPTIIDTISRTGSHRALDVRDGVAYIAAAESGVQIVDLAACAKVADLNGDGVVSSADLGVLLAAWATPAADLDGDGTTSSSDLGILLAAWTP